MRWRQLEYPMQLYPNSSRRDLTKFKSEERKCKVAISETTLEQIVTILKEKHCRGERRRKCAERVGMRTWRKE